MGKKKIIAAIESLKKIIYEHLERLEEELKEKNEISGFYHFKEIQKSFFPVLLKKYKELNLKKQGELLVKKFQIRLDEIVKRRGYLDDFSKKLQK